MMIWHLTVEPVWMFMWALSFIYNPTIRELFIYATNLTMWGVYGIYQIIWSYIVLSLWFDSRTTTSADKWLALLYTLITIPTAYF